jgi:hypothetical protein
MVRGKKKAVVEPDSSTWWANTKIVDKISAGKM